MTNNKFIIIYLSLLILFGSCVSSPKAGDLPNSLYGGNPMEWAELRVSGTNIYVKSIDGHMLNWGPGFKTNVPTGKHTIIAGSAGFKETVTMECEFLPGHSYMISYFLEDINTQTTSFNRITTYSGKIVFQEFGVIQAPVPNRNESIVEFTLAGSLSSRIAINDQYYKLSPFKEDSAEKLILVLAPGNYHIQSLHGNLELDLSPNRLISINVSTNNARIDKVKDEPLNYLGQWRFDIDRNIYVQFTFSLEGHGFFATNQGNNIVMDESGYFSYSADNSGITMTSGPYNRVTMKYRLSQDLNRLTLENFLGLQGITLTGNKI